MTMVVRNSVDELAARARQLAWGRPRTVLGLAGPPGAGKSTLARPVAEPLGRPAASRRRWTASTSRSPNSCGSGGRDRKGAPDTFDAAGYAALLTRLASDEPVVYAPEFRREIEEPIAGAIAVPPRRPARGHRGQLPAPDARLGRVRPLLDEAWYVETADEPARRQRLVDRHVASASARRRAALGDRPRRAQRGDLVRRASGPT